MENLVIGDELAKKLAQQLNLDFILIEDRVFSDGEVQPRLEKEKEINKAILIFQKKQNEDINAYLIKFLLLLRKVKELAQEIICIMPYFPYARQDSVFQEGESLSSLYIAELIEKDTDVFVTCNMHEHRKKIGDLFKISCHNVFLFQDLAEEFKNFSHNNSVVVGPDKESEAFVDDFCKRFSAQKAVFQKKRDVKTGEISFTFDNKNPRCAQNLVSRFARNKNPRCAQNLVSRFTRNNCDFAGKDVIIVDDIVSTGRTILQAAEIVKELKAKTISFAFIHSIFGDKAIEQLNKINPKKIVFTNTLESSRFSVDIVKPLAQYFLENKLI